MVWRLVVDGGALSSQRLWCWCMCPAISVRSVSDCCVKVRLFVFWIRCTSAMTECSTQLLFVADVLWHARPACCKAVVSGGMGSAIFWPWWWLFPPDCWWGGFVLAGLVGCVGGVWGGVACVGCVCCGS